MRFLFMVGACAFSVVQLGCSRSFSPPAVSSALLAVDPPGAQVAPQGATVFAIHGGRAPYVLVDHASQAGQATLVGSTVRYVAGPTGSVGDTFVVGDQAGRTVTVRVQIGGALSLTPPSAAVPVRETQLFVAQGGQAPYRFSVDEGLRDAGGSVDQGLFTAGARAGAGQVTVLDANDAGASVQIVVTAGVTVIPQNARIAPGGHLQMVAVGGRPPYAWSVIEALSTPDAGIDTATGELSLAATEPAGTLHVRATDNAGEPGTAEVVVLPALQGPPIPPATVVVPGFEFDLLASGGSAPYQFRFLPRGNVSGGSVTPAGHYRAGPNAQEVDHLEVVDTTGTAVPVKIEVGRPTLSSTALLTTFGSAAGFSSLTPWMQNGELLARSVLAVPPNFGAGLVRYNAGGQLLPTPMPPGAPMAYADLNGDGQVDLVLEDPLSPGHALVYVGSTQGNFTLVGGGGPVPGALAVMPEFVIGASVRTSRQVFGAAVGPGGVLDVQAGTVEDLITGRGLQSITFDGGGATSAIGVVGALGLGATSTLVDGAVVTRAVNPDGGRELDVTDISYRSLGIVSPQVVMQDPALIASLPGSDVGSRPLLAAPLRGDANQPDLVLLMNATEDYEPARFTLVAVLVDPAGSPSVVSRQLPGFNVSAPDAPDQVLTGPSRGGLGSVVVATRQGDLTEYDLIPGKDGGWDWAAPQPLAELLSPSSRAAVAGTGDLDGDGNLDLALTDSSGGLTVYFGMASGGFEGISPTVGESGTRFRGGAYRVPFQYQPVPIDGGAGLLVDDDGALSLLVGSTNSGGVQPVLGLLDQTPPVGFAQMIGTFTDAASGRLFVVGYDGVSQLLGAELASSQIRSPQLITELIPGEQANAPPQFALIDRVRGGPGSTLAMLLNLPSEDGGSHASLDLLDLEVGGRGLSAAPRHNVLVWPTRAPVLSFVAVDLDGVPPADLVFTYPGQFSPGPGQTNEPWSYYALATPGGDGTLGTPVGMMVPPLLTDARVLADPAGKGVVVLDAMITSSATSYRATWYPTGAGFGSAAGVTLELGRASDGGAGCLLEPITLVDDADGGLDVVGTLLHPRNGQCSSGPRTGNNLPAYLDVASGSVAFWRLGATSAGPVTPRETAISGAHTAPNWILLDANGDGTPDVAAQLVRPHTTTVTLSASTLRASSAALDLNLWAGLPDGGFAP